MDKIKNWELLHEKTILKDDWINVSSSSYMANESIIEPFYTFNYPDWVIVVPFTKENEVVLVRQFRPGAGKVTLEFPSGSVDPNDASISSAAERELLEETGYKGVLQDLGKMTVSSSTHKNICHLKLVKDCIKTQEQDLEEKEILESILLTPTELFKKIEEGDFFVGVQVAAFYKACLQLGLLTTN